MLEPHHAYFLGGLVVAYALVRGAGLDARQRRRAGGSLAVFGALVAAGVGWQWLVRETLLVGSVVAGGRSLAEIRVSSPGLSALGDWDTYGGRAVALLAVPGLLLARGVLPAFWGAVAALGLVLGLGPTVPGLPLYETLHRVLPGFAFIRNVPRFHFLALLGLTALAALGARALGARVPPRRRVAAGLALLGLVLADTVPRHGIAVMRLADHPVYTRLRAEARRVLYLPLFAGDSVAASAALYHPTRTRVPMLNGYSPLAPRAYDAEIVRPLRALNVGDVGEAERAWLRRLGVSHVVLDRAAPGVGPFPFAFVRARLAGAGGLALVEGTDPLWLFRVTDHYTVPVVLPTSPVGLLLEAEQLARDTGAVTREADASAGALVVARAERDAPGRLIAGALAFLPRGVYRVTLHARGEAGALEIWSEDGTRRLAATPWPAGSGWCDVTVTLPLTHAQAVRVAVPWAGRADAAVDAVHVVFADRPEPEWTFEAAALPHWGGERADPPATAGRAVLVASSTPPGLVVVQGPTRTFPSGRHRLLLRARLAAPGTGALLSVAVEGPAGLVRASRVVEAAELAEDAYREVALDFALDRVTVLDFPVSYLGAAGVYLDRLRVIPNPG
jgi:hypothetical protein